MQGRQGEWLGGDGAGEAAGHVRAGDVGREGNSASPPPAPQQTHTLTLASCQVHGEEWVSVGGGGGGGGGGETHLLSTALPTSCFHSRNTK